MAYILVVEDSRDNREVTRLILQGAGHTVLIAPDGVSGLDAAVRAKPDLILMDLALPHIDGWEATRRLKEDPATRDIPVIAFTAHVLAEDMQRARDVGCAAVIAKPFKVDTLLQQVDHCLLR